VDVACRHRDDAPPIAHIALAAPVVARGRHRPVGSDGDGMAASRREGDSGGFWRKTDHVFLHVFPTVKIRVIVNFRRLAVNAGKFSMRFVRKYIICWLSL